MVQLRRRVVFLVTAVGLAATAMIARAQTSIQDFAQNADSLLAAGAGAVPDSIVALMPRWTFSPTYSNWITADISTYSMKNEILATLLSPWNSIVRFQLYSEEKNYRVQNRLDENKLMLLSVLHPFNPNLAATLAYSDVRTFNRSITVGGGVQDFVVNDLTMTGGLNYTRSFADVDLGGVDVGAFRVDAGVSASAVNGERVFKTDETFAGSVFAGFRYEKDRLTLFGRGNLRESDETSKTTTQTLNDLGTSEDSVVVVGRVQLADSAYFQVNHFDYNGEREFADQERTSLGGQTGGTEGVYSERELHPTKKTELVVTSRLLGKMMFDLSAFHEFNEFKYDSALTRNSATTTDGFRGSVAYKPWRSMTTNFSFEGSSAYRDLRPNASASVTDDRNLARVALSQSFSPTFYIDLNASTQLTRSLYETETSRDRDQLDTSLSLRVTSTPFTRVLTTIVMNYTNSEFINIDATQSESNRSRDLYEFRPGFSYYVNSWLTVSQNYGLAIEFTDYKYQDEQNFLDRNISFRNDFMVKPSRRVNFVFGYSLLLHDTGSYLPDEETGEELLSVESEDRRDDVNLRLDYKPSDRLTFFGENTYSRRVEETTGSDDRRTTTQGSLRVGAIGAYKWGETGRKLSFTFVRVQRFSPFGSDEEKNFWDARSEFMFPF